MWIVGRISLNKDTLDVITYKSIPLTLHNLQASWPHHLSLPARIKTEALAYIHTLSAHAQTQESVPVKGLRGAWWQPPLMLRNKRADIYVEVNVGQGQHSSWSSCSAEAGRREKKLDGLCPVCQI